MPRPIGPQRHPSLHADGLDCPRAKSSRPRATGAVLDDAGRRRPREWLHRGPRDFGKPTGLWALDLAAEVAHARGPARRRVGGETIRQPLRRPGVGWKRARTWIPSPDPAYPRKKGRATG